MAGQAAVINFIYLVLNILIFQLTNIIRFNVDLRTILTIEKHKYKTVNNP